MVPAFGRMFSARTGQARIGYRPSKKSIQRVVEKIHALTDRSGTCQSLAIPGEALLEDHDPLEPALPFTNEQPASLQCDARGPGNGILRAETGGLFQAQNAGEQSEFGSQTTLRLTNPPELRGFLSTRKPPRFVGTVWSEMDSNQRYLSPYCLTRSRSFRSARHRQPWRLRV